MRPVDLFASVLLFSTVSSAWPAESGKPSDVVQHQIENIARQEDSTSSKFNLNPTNKEGNTADSTPSATDDTSTATDASGSEITTGTAKETGTAKDKGSGTHTTSMKTFDARLPAGGVSMLTPNVYTTQYYKIRDHVTFAWNYTSLSASPSAVDVLASCNENHATYTIALNQTFKETQKIIWDTGAFQASASPQLLTGEYTLIVYDASKDVTSTPMAGYLDTFNQFTFGMYLPQAYTPIDDFVCATCNSALSLAEKQTLWALSGMAVLTVLSFGWFTGVAGLW